MSVKHSTFSLDRTYDASPGVVRRPARVAPGAFEVDFRVGGREINRGGPKEV